MRILTALLIVSLPLGLAACTEYEVPKFLNPMPVSVPAENPAIGARLEQSDTESAILSWMERGVDGASLRFARYHQGDWGAASTVVADERMFVNWADLPSVQSIGDDALLAHWLSYVADAPYAYQVLTAHSTDGGKTWSNPITPHTDATPTEHGFVSGYPATGGTGLIWLDGRETPDKGMTLRSAVLGVDGSVSGQQLVDDLTCDCCQTDVAVAKSGPVAVYRNRTSEEVRDIYVTRNIDGQWQQGQPLSDDGWVIDGCPVNGPSIAALGNHVAVAWFTAAGGKTHVKTAYSKDSGQTFSEPSIVAAANTVGHVGIAMITEHAFAVSWMESDDGDYAINIRAATLDGQLDRVRTVGRTGLVNTVPQMVRVGDKLILAWTDKINDLNKVASVAVPILGFYD